MEPTSSWRKDSAMANRARLLQLRVLLRVRFPVKAGRDEDFRRHILAFGVADDRIDDLQPHLVRKLNRVGVNLSVLDRLLAFRLAVKADDDHLLRLARLLQRRARA